MCKFDMIAAVICAKKTLVAGALLLVLCGVPAETDRSVYVCASTATPHSTTHSSYASLVKEFYAMLEAWDADPSGSKRDPPVSLSSVESFLLDRLIPQGIAEKGIQNAEIAQERERCKRKLDALRCRVLEAPAGKDALQKAGGACMEARKSIYTEWQTHVLSWIGSSVQKQTETPPETLPEAPKPSGIKQRLWKWGTEKVQILGGWVSIGVRDEKSEEKKNSETLEESPQTNYTKFSAQLAEMLKAQVTVCSSLLSPKEKIVENLENLSDAASRKQGVASLVLFCTLWNFLFQARDYYFRAEEREIAVVAPPRFFCSAQEAEFATLTALGMLKTHVEEKTKQMLQTRALESQKPAVDSVCDIYSHYVYPYAGLGQQEGWQLVYAEALKETDIEQIAGRIQCHLWQRFEESWFDAVPDEVPDEVPGATPDTTQKSPKNKCTYFSAEQVQAIKKVCQSVKDKHAAILHALHAAVHTPDRLKDAKSSLVADAFAPLELEGSHHKLAQISMAQGTTPAKIWVTNVFIDIWNGWFGEHLEEAEKLLAEREKAEHARTAAVGAKPWVTYLLQDIQSSEVHETVVKLAFCLTNINYVAHFLVYVLEIQLGLGEDAAKMQQSCKAGDAAVAAILNQLCMKKLASVEMSPPAVQTLLAEEVPSLLSKIEAGDAALVPEYVLPEVVQDEFLLIGSCTQKVCRLVQRMVEQCKKAGEQLQAAEMGDAKLMEKYLASAEALLCMPQEVRVPREQAGISSASAELYMQTKMELSFDASTLDSRSTLPEYRQWMFAANTALTTVHAAAAATERKESLEAFNAHATKTMEHVRACMQEADALLECQSAPWARRAFVVLVEEAEKLHVAVPSKVKARVKAIAHEMEAPPVSNTSELDKEDKSVSENTTPNTQAPPVTNSVDPPVDPPVAPPATNPEDPPVAPPVAPPVTNSVAPGASSFYIILIIGICIFILGLVGVAVVITRRRLKKMQK